MMRWLFGVLFFLLVMPVLAQSAQVSATATDSDITLRLGDQQVIVQLIRTEPDVREITATLYDLGNGLLGVETRDPNGRALPNVHITPINVDGVQTAVMLQTNNPENYRFRQIGTANLQPFILDVIGTTTADNLHTLLSSTYSGGVNLLIGADPAADLTTEVIAYHTRLSQTAVVMPLDLVGGEFVPTTPIDVPNTLVMHVANLSESPYVLVDLDAQITTPDFSSVLEGETIGNLSNALEIATESMPYGFQYDIRYEVCPNTFGTVLDQQPLANTPLMVFDEPIQLTICANASGQVATGGSRLNIRSGAGLNVANIVLAVPNGTPLTVLGRSTDDVWLRVHTENGYDGWVSRDLVALDVPLESLPVLRVPIINFTADNYSLFSGQCAALSWRVQNTTQVLYRGSVVSPSNSVLECPSASVTYYLTVTGENGQVFDIPLSLSVSTSGY